MKVILTHGYFIAEDLIEQQIMKPYPPLGLLYIKAYLTQSKINCSVFDSTFETKGNWQTYVQEEKPNIIMFYTNLMTKINIIKLNNWLKETHPTITTVLGGPDVSYNLENYLSQGFDYCIIGEGEQTSVELTREIEKGTVSPNIDGIAYLKDGELVKTTARQKLKSLSELPLPDRESIDLSKYLDTWKNHHGKSTLNISTQRGCPYTCKWCSTAVYGQSYRRRPADQVVDEILLLQEQYQVEALWFVDDVFTVSHKWLEAFYNEMLKKKVKIEFEIITRAERLNEEILRMLKEIGCFRIWIGAESGSQKIIDKMDRKVSIDDVRDKINLTKTFGIEAGTFIMVGYPDETQDDIEKTVKYLEACTPSQFTITLAYPIKGTALYQEIENDITHMPDWATSTDREIDFKRTYQLAYYKHAIRYISNSYQAAKNANPIKSKLHLTKAKVAHRMMNKLKT
ncbi:MAG: anaerobic magnesium-protoporphyrin IX monomethyl ester cyclase [Parvicellaceae bacterium]